MLVIHCASLKAAVKWTSCQLTLTLIYIFVITASLPFSTLLVSLPLQALLARHLLLALLASLLICFLHSWCQVTTCTQNAHKQAEIIWTTLYKVNCVNCNTMLQECTTLCVTHALTICHQAM